MFEFRQGTHVAHMAEETVALPLVFSKSVIPKNYESATPAKRGRAGLYIDQSLILGTPSRAKLSVFLNIVQTEGGGSNPCSKNFVANFVYFWALFGGKCSKTRGGGGVKGRLNNVKKKLTIWLGRASLTVPIAPL